MTRAILAVLFLAACAPTQPTEYQQGAFRPAPRPPAFTPSQDAPHTTGQPGHVGAPTTYPRTPHKRLLPPTAEPTIYGGDEPKASLPRFDPNLGRITLPHPKHAGLGAQPFEDIEPVMDCAKGMEVALAVANSNGMWRHYYDVLPHMPPNNRMACVAAKLYKHCADGKYGATSDPKKRKILEEIQKVAKEFFRTSCDGITLTKHENDIVDAATGVWKP
jgi:hypothetical protein